MRQYAPEYLEMPLSMSSPNTAFSLGWDVRTRLKWRAGFAAWAKAGKSGRPRYRFTGGTEVRVKTENRKQAIIDTAVEVFREVGFERASMTTISRRLGGSKGTLYGYFKSKAELFEAAMNAAVEAPGDQIMKLLDTSNPDLRGCLVRFSTAYLNFILAENVLAIKRTATADGFDSSLGPHLFEQGPNRAIAKMTKFFAEQIKRGHLRDANPATAAIHFKGLIESGFLEEALYGAEPQFEMGDAIPEAVDAFLIAYAPLKKKK